MENPKIIETPEVVVRFSGDSGDGMQLAGTIFSTVAAILGNEISTFPDYPAEMRAPVGSLGGVSSYQVHVGKKVYTPGDECDVLVAMNPAALKQNAKYLKKGGVLIYDQDTFVASGLEKAKFTTDDPFTEMGLVGKMQILPVPVTESTKASLADSGMDAKSIGRCRNIFALGFVFWLFNRPIEKAIEFLTSKFGKKPAVLDANIKVITDGYNYGANTHASVSTYRIETKTAEPGIYCDVKGNAATAYGLVAAAEKAGLKLFLGSYPITPATDVLHELSKLKFLGVTTVQAEDEIAGICTAIGASFGGALAATSTSGPGIALKSEAIGLAVMAELPLVVIDVMRGGPSTGLPTKTEQTDLLQCLYGRNGECPAVVIAASSPVDCFTSAYMASKIALEHNTPVILLTDAFIGNGSSSFRIEDIDMMPEIKPAVAAEGTIDYKPFERDSETFVRLKAVPGTEGLMHRLGGLEKTPAGAITTDPNMHQLMVTNRQKKVDYIANCIPALSVTGDEDADTIVIGWGGTYGHISAAVENCRAAGMKVAQAHFTYISPLPKNTAEVLRRYKNVLCCELNNGQFAGYLRSQIEGLTVKQFNEVKGQPFQISDIEAAIKAL
ncbi:MAG: 2-oxoacid:acceptor oxidoreductase subunit alpha [Bacteroidales bacterium]|nr:2-oxoacid:acceptor oxidoreductase subunit alpha [Candidatus Liminaster caballi]